MTTNDSAAQVTRQSAIETSTIAAPHQAIPTARPPVKGTTTEQGRKGNSNRMFSLATIFSGYLTGS